MKDVSVEYAHIYTNNHVNDEQQLSLEILEKISEEVQGELSLVVMVDDYSFPDPTFNYDEFTGWLAEQGFKPDIVFRESQLIPLCDEVVSLISDERLKNQLIDYIRTKKYPCSLFIAAWYLLRLGHLESDTFNSDLAAKKLINILPSSFKPFEDKALEIIESTQYQNITKNIEHKYFEGRLVA